MQSGRRTACRLIVSAYVYACHFIFGVLARRGARPTNFGRFGHLFWRIIRPSAEAPVLIVFSISRQHFIQRFNAFNFFHKAPFFSHHWWPWPLNQWLYQCHHFHLYLLVISLNKNISIDSWDTSENRQQMYRCMDGRTTRHLNPLKGRCQLVTFCHADLTYILPRDAMLARY